MSIDSRNSAIFPNRGALLRINQVSVWSYKEFYQAKNVSYLLALLFHLYFLLVFWNEQQKWWTSVS